jgi:hypothetical protein
LSRLATAFILGYHGCTKEIADRAISGEINLLVSEQPYDWLGPGTYFWENDPHRALEFAHWKAGRIETFKNPTVIGAVIDLRNCFDLVARENLEALKIAYSSFSAMMKTKGLKLPENKNGRDGDEDRSLRFLDCAVIKHFFELAAAWELPSFDTARGMFSEGSELYQGAGFKQKSHVQIAVRTPDCIKGVFFPRPYPSLAS